MSMEAISFKQVLRPLVAVPHRPLDETEETEQGKSQSVQQLYQDYVLGRLDQSQIGGPAIYDAEGVDEVDPFNKFGITLEEATRIKDEGSKANDEIVDRKKKKASEDAAKAKAKAEAEMREKIEKELAENREGRKNDE